MSHIIIFMSIPGEKLSGNTSKENIDRIVSETLAPYVEDTAQNDTNIKIDEYRIGGRWEGFAAAIKTNTDYYPAERGDFIYDALKQYNLICNKGAKGPYLAGDTEFVPISGAIKKNIDFLAVDKLQNYMFYKYGQMYLVKDPFLGGTDLPEGWRIEGEDLYVGDTLFIKGNESWEERVARTGAEFSPAMIGGVDAYIDNKGVWHDDNELWNEWEREGMRVFMETGNVPEGNPHEEIPKMFEEKVDKFINEEVRDDDYLLIIDGHKFP